MRFSDMKCPPTMDLQDRMASLREDLRSREDVHIDDVRIVRSPYRACPLGAHVDHQGGVVTGIALDRCLLLAFAPRADGRVVLRSRQYAGVVEFDVSDRFREPMGDWADYARGAVSALRQRANLQRGLTALVDGYNNVSGLSSSAAVGVAYLLALEAANGMAVDAAGNVELDRQVENDFVGLSNGILDQSVILLGRRDRLLCMDCRDGSHELVDLGGERRFTVAVLFSGLRVPLAATGYNLRVAECRQAAESLLRRAGLPLPLVPRLRDVPADVFAQEKGALPESLGKRARHFFTEQERVSRGIELWRKGDLSGFGAVMNESGQSSVDDYECGNAYLKTAYEALRETPGVYGARFSGAGFRGCCIGLADPERTDEIRESALGRYVQRHPKMADEAELYFCDSADGAAMVG